MLELLTRSSRPFFWITLSTFFIDRITKIAALSCLVDGQVPVFPGLSFTLALNTGISFSLFASPTGSTSWVITGLVALVVALLITIWRFTATTRLADWAYGLIIGGAVGNFVDRLYVGGVVDFIDVYYGLWHWPTFNIADIAISIGFVLLVWETLHAQAH